MTDGESASDLETIRTVVSELYEVISGAAGEARDWNRFRSLFHEGARIVIASSPDGSIEAGKEWSVEEFAEAADEYYRRNGFWEREIACRMELFGNIAHSFSTYESRVESEESEPVSRGINSIQMIRIADRWTIVTIIFDAEGPEKPIPGKYL